MCKGLSETLTIPSMKRFTTLTNRRQHKEMDRIWKRNEQLSRSQKEKTYLLEESVQLLRDENVRLKNKIKVLNQVNSNNTGIQEVRDEFYAFKKHTASEIRLLKQATPSKITINTPPASTTASTTTPPSITNSTGEPVASTTAGTQG